MQSVNPSTLIYEAKQSTLVSPRGKRSALIIGDVQNDFFPGGTVPHESAEEIVASINRLRNTFRFDLVVIVRDWHPENHVSFAGTHMLNKAVEPFTRITLESSTGPISQLLWPTHCVQDTIGAEPHPKLQVYPSDVVIKKGTSVTEDSPHYFGDDYSVQTPLGSLLSTYHISDVFLCGIGVDHSLGRTAVEAAKLKGTTAFLVTDASAALRLDALDKAYAQLESRGVIITTASSMSSEREDRRRATAEYLNKHRVMPAFEKICANLVYHRPADATAFIVQELQKLYEAEGVLSSISLFSDSDIEVYFNMLDPTRKGVLTAAQAKQALEGLGLSADSLQLTHGDSFACSEFKVLVKRAVDKRALHDVNHE